MFYFCKFSVFILILEDIPFLSVFNFKNTFILE